MRIEYSTKIQGGNFLKETRDKLSIDLQHLEGKEVTISIEPFIKHRSNKQGRYYWGCIVEEQKQCFKERLGELFHKNEIHQFNKINFFKREIYDKYINEVIVFPGSTTRFSTLEFEEKLEMIRRYFETKFNWMIPAPHEQKLIFTNDEIIQNQEDDKDS